MTRIKTNCGLKERFDTRNWICSVHEMIKKFTQRKNNTPKRTSYRILF